MEPCLGNVLAPDFFYYLIPFKKVIKFGDSLTHAMVIPYSAYLIYLFFKFWLPEAQPEFTLYSTATMEMQILLLPSPCTPVEM